MLIIKQTNKQKLLINDKFPPGIEKTDDLNLTQILSENRKISITVAHFMD